MLSRVPPKSTQKPTSGSSYIEYLPGGRGQPLAFIQLLIRAVAMPAIPGIPTMVLQEPSMAVLVIWVVLQGTQETEHVFWVSPHTELGFCILLCLCSH